MIITKKWLEKRVDLCNKIHGTTFKLDYHQYYGYQLTNDTYMKTYTVRMTNKEMDAYLTALIEFNDVVSHNIYDQHLNANDQ